MANENAVSQMDWKRNAFVQAEITKVVDLERREYVEELAESRLQLRERQDEVDQLERKLSAQNEIVARLRELQDRSRNMIRSMHLRMKPSHRQKLIAKDAGRSVNEPNRLANGWCPTCAVLIEMERE